ncbi:ABC transporter substrate-binding protein [Oceanobacillus caeni]|uniref:Ethanolamine utilization protein EutJ n=1 Tax=Oceanobacillus caeni TaxID=405946 RepID=A0ABR5MN38_9BACI|nr:MULTISPECIES: ABC transporter substrate-binding protein [Bacillaceae]KPH78460.1 ethanolamine utilization protein EutJ [Oceanobacillus caeni]MBU8789267.1 ABC transporter substrate-binding protein [Oceanobacillus caeni]MCR1832948.1 ABC transporter substrate-binding protein [Oceanobacillus caeni]MED4474103.1 ABC transporter substrate-binding protein [Oceanobacillus caeni]
MFNIKKISLFGLLLIALILVGCVDVSNNQSTDNDAESTEASEVEVKTPKVKEGEKVVEIGYSGPLSGPGAQYGLNVLNGLEMAANEINETGFDVDGTTYKIEIVALDDKYLPNETGVNVKRMVSENEPVAVWIPHSGGVFATQVYNEQDNFIIMAYTSEPRQYEQGNELMIGIPPKYNIWSEPYSNYMIENFGTKMALLPTNSQYGKDWSESIVPVWEEKGGEIIYKTEIDFAKETDYFTIMTNALATDPDVLFVGGPSEPTALVIKQAKELGFEGGFMIMDQAKLEEMSGFLGGYEMLTGSIGSLPIEDLNTDASTTFVEKYKELYNEPYATSETALNYQSLYVLVGAMKAAGTVEDRKAIMKAVNEGIQNLSEEELVLPLEGIAEDGALQWEYDAGIVENGEVGTYPVD